MVFGSRKLCTIYFFGGGGVRIYNNYHSIAINANTNSPSIKKISFRHPGLASPMTLCVISVSRNSVR